MWARWAAADIFFFLNEGLNYSKIHQFYNTHTVREKGLYAAVNTGQMLTVRVP